VEIFAGFPLAKVDAVGDERVMRNRMLGRAMLWLAVLVGLVSVGAARAVGPEVRDNAALFSPAAVKQADAAIQKLQKELGKDLLVETFPGVPENRKADYGRNREEFFASFVRERAQAARLNGIYVMLMKEEPPHRLRVQVAVGEATRQRAFLVSDRDQLVRLLQSSFRAEKYDEGLGAAVMFVDRTLRSRLSTDAVSTVPHAASSVATAATSAPSGSSNWVKWMFIIGGVLVAVFILRLFAGGTSGGGLPGTGGFGGGGGGFFSSLLGGLGGAMAGHWLYDRFFGDNSHSHHGTSGMDAPSDVGGDYSSSGGDVGGSDFGGGDFGGGGGDV
jgi:hypothetical protein